MADMDNSATTTSDAPVTDSGSGFSALSGANTPAPATDPGNTTSDTPVSASDNGPAPAPAPAPAPSPAAPAKPPSKWESILTGALLGMTAGAGQKFFGTGVAA